MSITVAISSQLKLFRNHSEATLTRSMSSLMAPDWEKELLADRFSYNVTWGLKKFGPFSITEQADSLDGNQQKWMKYNMGIQPVIRFRHAWGIWVGSTCTRQCRHVLAFWSTSIPPNRYIPSARRGPCSRLGIYPVCQGITCTIDVV